MLRSAAHHDGLAVECRKKAESGEPFIDTIAGGLIRSWEEEARLHIVEAKSFRMQAALYSRLKIVNDGL